MSQDIPWKRLSVEGVAIVASILLAFAIDAWWGERLEHRLGVEYEQRIASELRGIRIQLENSIVRTVLRNIEMGETASAFFDVDREPISNDRLIVSLYNMGRDPPDKFDVSTYQDLISSGRLGLIRDVPRRQAIQRAYTKLQDLETVLRPHRNEYLSGVRAWIPQKVVAQIRDACPSISAQEWMCSEVDIDDQVARHIIEKLSTDQALIAFRLREQGLPGTLGFSRQAMQAIDEALDLFD